MSGSFYYYRGGGNSPQGWFAWLAGLAVLAVLGVLFLPVLGAVVVVLLGVAVVAFIVRLVMGLAAGKRAREAEETDQEGPAADPFRNLPGEGGGNPAGACDPDLEVKDAEVIEEIPHRGTGGEATGNCKGNP